MGLIQQTLITGCERKSKSPKNQQTNVIKIDSNLSKSNFIEFYSIEAEGQRIRDTNYIYLNKLLDSALKLAKKQDLEKPFTAKIDSTAFKYKNMYALILFGHIFSTDRKHLIIKRFINEYADYETNLYSDIYLLEKTSLSKVVADTSDNGYGEDYLEDLNHDRYKDFVVQSYSGAGCCPRNLEMGFLYNQLNGRFKALDFFNRESDSLSNIFYETSYGLGDYINLYKYRWSGLRKILLEEIYVTLVSTDKKPSSYTKIIYPSERKLILKKLPNEYKKLKMSEYITQIENK